MNSPSLVAGMPYSTKSRCLMSNGKSKNLLAAIADLRAASAAMKNANAGKASPTKTSKNRRKRAARRAAKAASGSPNGSPLFVSAPSAMTRMRGQTAAQMRYSSNGQVAVIAHREYVAEVPGATAWTTTSFVIQPALQALFVWLATIAANFEKYRFRRLRFCYETESPTSQAGSVVLAIDYDAVDAAPLSKQAALSYKSAVRTAPWQQVCLDCDLSRDAQRDLLYTRSGSVPSGNDQKLYDLGQLHVGVQNSSGSTGELWVEYEIELHTPQPNVNPISSKFVGTTSLTATALVGADSSATAGSNAGWVVTSASTFTCTIAGTYLFAVLFAGTTIVCATLIPGGTATQLVSPAVCNPNAAATNAVGFVLLQAQIGQTYAPTITSAASLTSATWRIAQYAGALL